MKPFNYLGVAVILSLLSAPSQADSKISGLNLQAGLELEHNDNVFQYSPRNLNKFGNGDPKFGSLVSEDDLILTPSVRAAYRFSRFPATRVTFRADANLYQQNTIKNYQAYTAGIERALTDKMDLAFRYLVIPRFYIRPLADPGSATGYSDASFGMQSFKLTLDRSFKKGFSGAVFGLFERKDYNHDFDERDLTVWGEGAEVRMAMGPSARLTLGGAAENGTARGKNDPVYDSDISYRERMARAALNWKLTDAVSVVPELTYTYRHYTTDLAGDPNHYNRNDATQGRGIEVRSRLAKGLDGRVGYEYAHRQSNRDGVDVEFLQFIENRVTARIMLSF